MHWGTEDPCIAPLVLDEHRSLYSASQATFEHHRNSKSNLQWGLERKIPRAILGASKTSGMPTGILTPPPLFISLTLLCFISKWFGMSSQLWCDKEWEGRGVLRNWNKNLNWEWKRISYMVGSRSECATHQKSYAVIIFNCRKPGAKPHTCPDVQTHNWVGLHIPTLKYFFRPVIFVHRPANESPQ